MIRDVSVREVMNGDYVGVSESDGLAESVELLLSEDVDVAMVLRGNEAIGALTERAALSSMIDGGELGSLDVGDAMTDAVPTIQSNRGLHEARDRMTTAGVNWLLVTDGDEPLGVLTEHDLLAGSTIGTEPAPEAEAASSEVMTPTATAAGADSDSASDDAFSDQGICEVCGSMTGDLSAFNGQLRCSNCRDV